MKKTSNKPKSLYINQLAATKRELEASLLSNLMFQEKIGPTVR